MNELTKEFENNPKLEKAIRDALNYDEYLCLGIKQGVYDEELIKTFWGSTIRANFHRFRDYVLTMRKIVSPVIWEVVEEFVTRWEHSSIKRPDRHGTGS